MIQEVFRGFRALRGLRFEAVKVGMQTSLESFENCEEQPWPDCGGPSNTLIPITRTYSFYDSSLDSIQFPTKSFFPPVIEGIPSQGPELEKGIRNWDVLVWRFQVPGGSRAEGSKPHDPKPKP